MHRALNMPIKAFGPTVPFKNCTSSTETVISTVLTTPGPVFLADFFEQLQLFRSLHYCHSLSTLQFLKDKHTMKANVHYSLELGKIIHSLQLERGLTALYINSGRDISVTDRLQAAYKVTGDAVESISVWFYTDDNQTSVYLINKRTFFQYLTSLRERRENLTFEDAISLYTMVNQVFIQWMVNAVKDDRNNDYWADIVAYHMLINGKENIGLERAIGTYFFVNGKKVRQK